jgi:phosphonate transport system substrate-binding protein
MSRGGLKVPRVMARVLRFALPLSQISGEQEAFVAAVAAHARVELRVIPIPTHAGLYAAVESGSVDMLWAPPLVALDLVEWAGATPIATVVRRSRTSYPSVLFARDDETVPLATLLGRRIAWVSPLSAAGHALPVRFLEAEGYGREREEEHFFHTHEATIRAVRQGQAELGATYGQLSRTTGRIQLPAEAGTGLRVVAVAGFVPNEVILAGRRVSSLERLSLGESLRRRSPEELRWLGPELGAERFSLQVTRHLEPLRRLTRIARQSDAPPRMPLQPGTAWLALIDLLAGEHQVLGELVVAQGLDDGGHILDGDAAQELVVWLDQDGDPLRAYVEAARGAGAGLVDRQLVGGQGALEGGVDLLGTPGRAGALGSAIRAAVDADEQVTLSLRHGGAHASVAPGAQGDILACPCGHRMKYSVTLFDKKGLARLRRAKGLPHHIEPIRPAKSPPQQDFGP